MWKTAMFLLASMPLLISTPGRAQTLPEKVERLEIELAALRGQMQRLTSSTGQEGAASQRGERGQPGPPGPTGPKGEKGEPGAPAVLGQLIELQPKGGAQKAVIAAGDVGGFSRYFNDKGIVSAYLGTATNSGGGLMQLSNSENMIQVEIASNTSGGVASFFFGTSKDGQRGQEVHSQIAAGSGGGLARFFNLEGKEVAYIGADAGGSGAVLVDGKRVHDLADVFDLEERRGVEPGMVMVVAGAQGRIAPSAAAYDRRVVGIISGAGGLQPGLVVGTREDGTNDLPLAVGGQVFVRVCLEGGPIEPGDLLVASSRKGVAMRAADPSKALGAVVGKALETFSSDEREWGLVRMIVMLR